MLTVVTSIGENVHFRFERLTTNLRLFPCAKMAFNFMIMISEEVVCCRLLE